MEKNWTISQYFEKLFVILQTHKDSRYYTIVAES